jgi:hypothetical protein
MITDPCIKRRPYLQFVLVLYRARAAIAAAPRKPMPTSGLTAAPGVELGVAVARADVTRFEAEATAEGLGLSETVLQIWPAKVVASEKVEVSAAVRKLGGCEVGGRHGE